jgi:hypothetical protein
VAVVVGSVVDDVVEDVEAGMLSVLDVVDAAASGVVEGGTVTGMEHAATPTRMTGINRRMGDDVKTAGCTSCAERNPSTHSPP